jgi:hypothetical protein
MTPKRASIDVSLGVEETLSAIVASFERSKTSTTRIDDGGWTIERSDGQLLIYPKKPHDHLLEPLPEDYVDTTFPETLALRIDALARPEGGTRVRARVIRRRVGALLGTIALDAIAVIGGLPLAHTIIYGTDMVSLRSNRRAAKLRLLRLALEPLIPHQRAAERGPFRE